MQSGCFHILGMPFIPGINPSPAGLKLSGFRLVTGGGCVNPVIEGDNDGVGSRIFRDQAFGSSREVDGEDIGMGSLDGRAGRIPSSDIGTGKVDGTELATGAVPIAGELLRLSLAVAVEVELAAAGVADAPDAVVDGVGDGVTAGGGVGVGAGFGRKAADLSPSKLSDRYNLELLRMRGCASMAASKSTRVIVGCEGGVEIDDELRVDDGRKLFG